jgi:glycosyltransferase involved in cell wall biosynthesis
VRAWIVNQYALPPSQSGGTRHYSLARALQAHGIVAEIFCSSRNYLSGARVADAGTAREDGVDFTFLDTGGGPVVGRRSSRFAAMIGFRRSFRQAARRRIEAPDVIIGSSPSLIGAEVALEEARRRAVPFVLEVRDLWPLTLVEVGGLSHWHPAVLLFGWLERRLYRQADHIVTLLPNAAEHIARRCPGGGPVTWIPNGIDLRLVGDPTRAPRRPALWPDDGAFTLMYAGAHGLANALDPVLDATAVLERRHPGRFRLVLVGDGHEKVRLRQRAERERLPIVFLDPVPKAEVYRLLARADALVMNIPAIGLYQAGTSPNKLFDYLAAGRPVLAGTSGADDLVARAGAGISVAGNDPAALAQAAERLAALPPAEREAMGARARAFVEANHDIERLAERYAVVLRSLVTERTPVRVSA